MLHVVIGFASHFQCSYSQHSKHVGTEGGGTRNIPLRGDGASRWACGARPVCWLHQKVPGDMKSQHGRLAGRNAQRDRQWSHPGGVRVRTDFKEEDRHSGIVASSDFSKVKERNGAPVQWGNHAMTDLSDTVRRKG